MILPDEYEQSYRGRRKFTKNSTNKQAELVQKEETRNELVALNKRSDEQAAGSLRS